ncbi:MAG: dihydroorotate dehydrogenase [Elusimicrobia bacterium]|nr:dihydroorotate dehydrogenase [Elusimicrobiota bacterium]
MSSSLKHIKNLNSKETEFHTIVAGIRLEHPLMNAAGTCKLVEEVETLARTATAAIEVGSITVEEREGNVGETYWSGNFFSLNSRGLPNPGLSYYRRYLSLMVAIARNSNKPLFVSVVGFSPDEYAFLTELVFQKSADLVTLNLGCSNIWENGEQKRIPGFDSRLTAEILRCVKEKVGKEAKLAVKLPPFSNPRNLKEIAQVIIRSEIIKAVTTSDTFPNALSFNEKGESRIVPGSGLAALGGSALNPIALGQIKQFRDILPKHIDVVGVGGVTTGRDIVDFRRAGANVVQVATAILNKDPRRVFDRLLIEFSEVMKEQKRMF